LHELSISTANIARVEGHGRIKISLKEGKIEELLLQIPESPRFFEAMFRGRPHYEVSLLATRICGICAVGHCTASLRATEAALGIVPSEQTVLLRRLNLHGEMIQSHVLHVYFLVAPDFLGVPSVIPLAQTHPEVVKRALRMKKLANDLCCTIGGRHVHPISPTVNGFTSLPSAQSLRDLHQRLEHSFVDLEATLELVKTFKIPEFERPTEYVSLQQDGEYAFYEGDIFSSEGGVTPPELYQEIIKERMVKHSTAKHASATSDSFMVGALARFNNNHRHLRPKAQVVAESLGLKTPCHNPFMISVAQLVETVHCTEEAMAIIEQLLACGIKQEERGYEVGKGRGVGAVEVPRGTLYHDYSYDKEGKITLANCIIPTGQNLANIEGDLCALVPQILDKSKEEITLLLEMLVRAYDPCISCATHLLKVELV